MRRIAPALFVAALWLAHGPPATAQTRPPTAQPTAAEALARRFLTATRLESIVNASMTAMMPVIVENMAKRDPSITPQDRAKISEIVLQTMREDYLPKLIDRAASVYATTFTEAELKAMVDFYEGPVGQAFTAKAPNMAPKIAEITRDLLPDFQTEILRRFCTWRNCLAPPPAAISEPKPS